eukprot:CAMPEP_0118971814 /NCGR_PEP_ID=MMETSP1173-20130426/8336_1 /TAXON_ID=1034831 /ORGANISM="Rhizochromulina marina cf, Strain CCMP1243" /LENGTH=116 /DNA_ID=CAMNT_0006921309 /DNA_START=351 /DNA_END=698 /DNA_ORIENTATION=-
MVALQGSSSTVPPLSSRCPYSQPVLRVRIDFAVAVALPIQLLLRSRGRLCEARLTLGDGFLTAPKVLPPHPQNQDGQHLNDEDRAKGIGHIDGNGDVHTDTVLDAHHLPSMWPMPL